MSYPVAEKIFERCLGSPLTSEQEIEVRELLKAMSDADWPVEEPTSAAFPQSWDSFMQGLQALLMWLWQPIKSHGI